MATGDIGIVRDTLTFDAVNATLPSIIRTGANMCAIPYCGPDNDGFLKTAEINAAGQIDDTVKDTLEFDVDFQWNNSIIHIAGLVYAIAYRGPANHGLIKTVQINADGSIEDAPLDELEFDAVNCDFPDIIKVGDEMYAIAYTGELGYGVITTVAITDAGALSADIEATLAINAVATGCLRIKRVGATSWYVVVQARDTVLYAQSVSISADGTISIGGSQELLIEDPCGATHSVIGITGNIFAVAYQGPGTDGWLKTITANDDGTFEAGSRDSMEFGPSDCHEPRIIAVAESVYAIAYTGASTTGNIVTVTIHDTGLIDDSEVDSLVFGGGDVNNTELTHINGDIYAVAYRTYACLGKLITFDIETPEPTGVPHLMMMGIG